MKTKTIFTYATLFSFLLLSCGSPRYGCPTNFSSTEAEKNIDAAFPKINFDDSTSNEMAKTLK